MPDQLSINRSAFLDGAPLGPSDALPPTEGDAGPPPKPRTRGGVPSGPMKELTDAQVKRALKYAATAYDPPEAAVLKFVLSLETGARASEIAKLRMTDVTDGDGNIDTVVRFPKAVAKRGRARRVPMTPLLRDALNAYRQKFPGIEHLATAYNSGKRQNPPAVKAWFHNFYKRLGLKQCGSHSGRKTFITNAAKMAPHVGMTLRDVQELAGHARLNTTQAYIAVSPNHEKLVAAISAARLFDALKGGR